MVGGQFFFAKIDIRELVAMWKLIHPFSVVWIFFLVFSIPNNDLLDLKANVWLIEYH